MFYGCGCGVRRRRKGAKEERGKPLNRHLDGQEFRQIVVNPRLNFVKLSNNQLNDENPIWGLN